MRYKLYSGWPRNRNINNMHRYVFHLNQQDIFLSMIYITIDPCEDNGKCPPHSYCSHADNSTTVICTCDTNYIQGGQGTGVLITCTGMSSI